MRLLAILCPWKAGEGGKIKPTAADTLHTQIYVCGAQYKALHSPPQLRAYDTRLCPFIGPTVLSC